MGLVPAVGRGVVRRGGEEVVLGKRENPPGGGVVDEGIVLAVKSPLGKARAAELRSLVVFFCLFFFCSQSLLSRNLLCLDALRNEKKLNGTSNDSGSGAGE